MIKGGIAYRVETDHLGSPRLVVNATTGAIAQRVEYDELGNVLSDSNPGFQPFGLAGGLFDLHTRLSHFGAREFSSDLGRWMTKDPIGLQGGSNVYSYAQSDPIDLIDTTGLISFDGSIYAGTGVGLKVSITSQGVSVCFELGFGYGSSFSASTEGLQSASADVFVEGGVKLLGIGLKGGSELASCGEIKFKSEQCLLGLCAKQSKTVNSDENTLGPDKIGRAHV